MAEQVLDKHEQDLASLEFIPSGGGAFEVKLNDTLIFSKFKEGRFPEHAEVLKQLS